MNKPDLSRRKFIHLTGGFAGVSALAVATMSKSAAIAASGKFEIEKTSAQWQKILSPNQFAVLRKEATERQYTSPLLKEKRTGSYHCAGCDLPVYHSSAKYDSRTGWPSFYKSLDNAIGTKIDKSFFSTRTEVHCRRCGGHFGHIFDDGPAPTGKRHCLNGLALTFHPQV